MTSSMFLSRVGAQAATNGFAAVHPEDLTELLGAGCQQAVSPVLLGVLADPAAPEVTRLRALSRLLVRLERTATGRLADDYVHAA